jgi:Flp pilus assembly protein TadD
MNLSREFGFTADQTSAMVSQAFDLIDADDLDGAAVVFEGLLVLNPNDGRIQAALGSVFHQQGKLSEAMAAYDAALNLDADAVLARVNRGELRCKRGDKGGVEDLKIAARIPSAVQARAQALVRLYAR